LPSVGTLLVVIVVVLLKDGILEAVSCHNGDVFRLAQAKDAGICGIFENTVNADAFIHRLREEQRRNEWTSRTTAHAPQTE